jgi:hypothetical protein
LSNAGESPAPWSRPFGAILVTRADRKYSFTVGHHAHHQRDEADIDRPEHQAQQRDPALAA